MSTDGGLIEVIKAEVQKTTKLVELERLGRGGCKRCQEMSRVYQDFSSKIVDIWYRTIRQSAYDYDCRILSNEL